MAHHWKVGLILAGLILIGGLIYAQVPSISSDENIPPRRDEKTNQVLKLARSLYDELSLPGKNAICRFSYALEATVRSEYDSLITKTDDVRYEGSADFVHMESSDVSFYQDTSVGIAILTADREIRIFPSSFSKLEAARRESMNTFRDALFAESSVEHHRQAGNEHRISLVPTKEFRAQYGIDRIAISLIPDERRLVSIRAEFDKRSRYASMSMRYDRVVCSEGKSSEEGQFGRGLNTIFENDGTLRHAYRDYAVVDLRSEDR